MIRARALPLFSLIAAAALFVPAADAAQRGERRSGGQPGAGAQDSGRRAQPRPPTDGSGARAAAPDHGGPDVVVAGPNAVVQGRGYRGPVNTYRAPRGGYGAYGTYPNHGRYPGFGYWGYRGPAYGGFPLRYARPYYAFRPRFSIGLGFYAGYAVPFPRYGYAAPYPYGSYGYAVPYAVPYAAPYPVPYPVPYAAPYPPGGAASQAPSNSISATPGPSAYGGVSIDVTPSDAEVWVDGGYAGKADDFGPSARPLTLPVGLHRIEVRAPGYQSMSFDVTVTPGYVVPYQGVLQPQP